MPSHACIVLTGLLAWGMTAIVLVRRAELRDSHGTLPSTLWTIVGIVAVAVIAIRLHPPSLAASYGAACIALLVAGEADARSGYLYDAVTFPAALLVALLATMAGPSGRAAIGVLLLVAPFVTVVALSRGRLMGLGDVKAMYALGAAFGPFESSIAVFVACLSGIGSAAMAGRFASRTELRFGPHLATGAIFTLIAGDPIARTIGGS